MSKTIRPRSGLMPDMTAQAAVSASISQTPLPLHADLRAVVVDGPQIAVAAPGALQGVFEFRRASAVVFLPRRRRPCVR